MKKNINLALLIKEYLIITIGVILVSIGVQYFYAPNEIAGGGLSGLSLVINNYVPSLSIGTIIFIGNVILFIIAFILVGGDFGMKTIYASFSLSFVMDFMEKVIGTFAIVSNPLLAVLIGTVITAAGIGMTFAINASTGGTDILAKIINKYYPTINLGIALLIVDLAVVVCGGLTFGLDSGIYSLLAVIMNGLVVDRVIVYIENKKKENNELEDEEVAA